ncbi:alpha/beta hydrolase family protein [Streptomyces fulvoviolaceus]|uniref:alpha/beta hydrolase family protein n=1 Tax=Streptomyces fulvoviolaceus TaxID=285535 RepID=UPI0021C1F5DC|nr:alpha/beta hydrolase family protein [Streptomyces fulvoviolaceus]MCT9079494.1 alpha/beta hydrolase family protein [Streptomyces fulvoviolaceus]
MASDFSRLMKQDFSDLEAAAKAWRELSTTMDSLTDRHRRQVTGPLHQSWKGDDADAALYYLEDVESRIGVVETEAMAMAEVMDTTKFWMEQAQTDLRNAVRRAEEDGLAVDGDGEISDPVLADLPRSNQVVAEERGILRAEHRAAIDAALIAAHKASDDGAKALAELNGDILTDPFNHDAAAESAQDVKNAMKAVGVQPAQIPEDDPKAAAEWWKALSPEERQAYTTLYPKEIGATDGLPTDVRDDANRTAVAQELNALQEGNYDEEFPGESDETVNRRLNNLQLLNDKLEARDSAPKGKELYLLGYDSKDDGRAIIAMGNPDTAAHTGILVPGTNTNMDAVPGQIERIGKLQNSAERQSDGESVAMITWLGYDAPEASMTDFNSVGGTGRAEDAAPDLRQFVAGTHASHDGSPSHTTVMGHSYGSTVVGAAASGGSGLGADDVVVVGSPGMTVDRAQDLQMDPEHVWIGGAQDDAVINHASDMTLGRDPMLGEFGGNNFEVDTHGHSGYWDTGSDSLKNQGAVIAGGQPTEVPKEDGDLPPEGYIVPGL